MPTLKRFARPLDWAGIDATLRRYAREVRKASANGQEAPEPSSLLRCFCVRRVRWACCCRALARPGGGEAGAAASVGAAAARGDEEVPPLKAGRLWQTGVDRVMRGSGSESE